MAIDNMPKKLGEDQVCSSRDMIADRQTHRETQCQTDRHCHHNTLLPYRRQSKNNGNAPSILKSSVKYIFGYYGVGQKLA